MLSSIGRFGLAMLILVPLSACPFSSAAASTATLAQTESQSEPGSEPENTPPVNAVNDPSAARTIEQWLVFGPVAAPLPAFADQAGGKVEAKNLLPTADSPLPDPWKTLWPEDGATWQPVTPTLGSPRRWQATATRDGRLRIPTSTGNSGDSPSLAWLATYVEARRFVKARLIVESPHPFKVWLNGNALDTMSESGVESDADETRGPASERAEITLTTGMHRLSIQTVSDPSQEADWTLRARIETAGSETNEGTKRGGAGDVDSIRLSLSPRRGPTIADYLDTVAVSDVSLSADGEFAALQFASPAVPAENRRIWIDLIRVADREVIRSLAVSGSISGFEWSPEGSGYAFATASDDRSTIWTSDLETGRTVPVVESIERLESFRFSPDGRSMILSITSEKPPEAPKHGAQRLRGLADRWTDWRHAKHLYQIAIPSARQAETPGPSALRRLTAGPITTAWLDGRHDGGRLLFQRTEESSQRPFQRSEVFELDLDRLTARSIVTSPWLVSASYSPDDARVLVIGGPTAFGRIGVALDDDTIANDYDGQAYLLDPETGRVDAISRDFSPAIEQAEWLNDDTIVFLAGDGARRKLFRYGVKAARFEELPTGVDAVDAWSAARNGSRLVFAGSSADQPPAVYQLDLDSGEKLSAAVNPIGSEDPDSLLDPVSSTGLSMQPKLLFDPDPVRRAQIEVGAIEDFSFTSQAGYDVTGRVHYPPDFDPERSYPALVYYYGGTAPVGRSWGGRYPKNLWAANGYVVYVLQPSGATGFGQEVSARHVNNWGRTVAGEIIEGTEAFLAAHPFVDPERVGCLGASYGGFMTLLLLTETDLFSAAVSHAGISSLSSYWGEGWWGYLYSAVASADSYPWNDPELYVGQSPLFRADRINTPLLLLHGSVDTNVPPGESEQMYTALKLLGREVEFIRIEGSNHQIFRYPKRQHWMATILAWFDKQLKDQPEHWFHLYPGSLREDEAAGSGSAARPETGQLTTTQDSR